MLTVAAIAAALGVLLAVRRTARLRATSARSPSRVAAVGCCLPLLVVVAPGSAVLALVAAGLVVGGLLLVRRRTRRRTAAATAARVLETCELVAGELAAGQPAGRALDRAASGWSELRPVAEAHALGGDVAGALREVATRPGAGDLRLLAAAWVVAHRTGAGLADAVHRTAVTIRRRRATLRVVEGELASARATARLVAALPVLALMMGSGSGGDPVAFLFGEPLGLACLVVGLAFGFAGLWWIEAIAEAASGGP